MKHFPFYIFMILFLGACHPSKHESTISSILNIDGFEKDKDFAFDSIEFIPLETNDSCLVYSADKIIHRNQFYYIQDRKLPCIFIFSEDGTFINSINRQGQGPAEYIEITNFDVDFENNIYIGSGSSRKIIKYKYPGYQKSEEYVIGVPFLEFAVNYETDQIWLANILDERGCTPLALYSNGKVTTKLATREIFDDIEKPFKRHSFSRSGDYLYFNPRYSSYVYELKKGDAIPFAEIKSARFISKEDLHFSSDDLNAVHDFYNKNLIEGFHFFYKSKDMYMGMIKNAGFMIYDITNQKGKWIKVLPHSPDVFTQDSNYFFTAISADIFKQRYPEQSKNISEYDNPILVKMKI